MGIIKDTGVVGAKAKLRVEARSPLGGNLKRGLSHVGAGVSSAASERLSREEDLDRAAFEELARLAARVEGARVSDEAVRGLAEAAFRFCGTATGVTLYKYQEGPVRRIILSLLSEDMAEICCLFSRQAGKTESIAVVVAGLMVLLPVLAKVVPDERFRKFEGGLRVGIFGPSYRPATILSGRLADRLYSKAMKEVMEDPEVGLAEDSRAGKRRLRLGNGSFCDVYSTGPRVQIEGGTYHLILLEECQDIPDQKITKCLAGDTVVYTARGRRRIDRFGARDFGPGPSLSQVTVVEGEGSGEHRFVGGSEYEHHANGRAPVFRVVTASGRHLDATLGHRWWATPWPLVEKPRVLTTVELRVGDLVATASEWRVRRSGEGTYRRGFVLGAVLGGGSVRSRAVVVRGSREFVDEVAEQARVEFGVEWEEFDLRAKAGGAAGGRLICGRFSRRRGVFENTLRDWLRELGVWNAKKHEFGIPAGIFVESAEFQRGLVAGMLGSGRGRRAFWSLSERLVLDLADVLWQHGIHAEVAGRGLRVYGVDARRLERFIAGEELSASCKALRWVRVVSIEAAGEALTYCFTLPGETFLANGLCSMNSIHPTGAATAATIVKIGTPSVHKCEFFDAIRRARRLDLALSSEELRTYFEVGYREASKANARYARYAGAELERLGFDSDEFKLSYRLLWLFERGMFMSEELLRGMEVSKRDELEAKDLRGRELKFVRPASLVSLDLHGRCAAGIDFGRALTSTVVTVGKVWWENPVVLADGERYFVHVLRWLELTGDDHEKQYPQILQFLGNFKVEMVAVDATGKGDPIYSRLAVDLSDRGVLVRPFVFSSQSNHDGFTLLLQEISGGRLTIPAGPLARKSRLWQRCREQLEDAEKNWRGRHMVVAKPAVRGARDDYVDSLMLLEMATQSWVSEAEAVPNPFFGRRGRGVGGEVRGRASWSWPY